MLIRYYYYFYHNPIIRPSCLLRMNTALSPLAVPEWIWMEFVLC